MAASATPRRASARRRHDLARLAPSRRCTSRTTSRACVAAAELFQPRRITTSIPLHRGHDFVNDTYALPHAYYARGLRRYGFHGLSYDYIAGELARMAPALHTGRVVVAHLGSGASMCAISGGRSVDLTMGFSALDGPPMGTRSGQIDPGVLLYMLQNEGMDAGQLTRPALQAIRAARHVGRVERHAHAGGIGRSACGRGDRLFLPPDPARDGGARGLHGRARWRGVPGGIGENSALCARRPAGMDWPARASTPPPMRRPRAISAPGGCGCW